MYPVSAKFNEAVLSGEQTVVQRCDILDENGAVIVEGLPIDDGYVTVDSENSVRRRAYVTLDDDGTWVPKNDGDALHPLANYYMKLWRGFEYSDGTEELVPQGVYEITDSDIGDSGERILLRIDGWDYSKFLQGLGYRRPYNIPVGKNFALAIKNLIADAVDEYTQHVFAHGAVAFWDFTEQSGSYTYDAISNREAQFIGTNGNWDSGLTFDGPIPNTSNHWITLGGIDTYFEAAWSAITGNNARTVEVFFKTAGNGGVYQTMASWGTSTDPGSNFNVSVTDVGVISAGTNSGWKIGTTVVTDNKWHWVVVTYPQGGNASTIKVYVDGQLETTTQGGTGTSAVNTTANNVFRIGRATHPSVTRYFNGSIEKVAIYNVELPADHIAEHYAESKKSRFQYSFANVTALTPQVTIGIDDKDNPWDKAVEMSKSIGHEVYFDGAGVCVLRPVPTLSNQPLVWTYDEGEEALVMYIARRLTKEETFNHIIVIGENTDNAAPVMAEAYDNDPDSPTYIWGPFGDRIEKIRSEFITTTAQCQAVADARLRQVLGTTEGCNIVSVVHPGHEPGDVIELRRERSMEPKQYVVKSVTMPMRAIAPLNMTMQDSRT